MSGRGKIRPTAVRRATIGATDDEIGPRAFKPFLPEIHDCHCKPCRQVSYANRDPRAVRADARELLDSLRAGTHVRVEFAAYVAEAKREHAARIAEACVSGVSDFRMFELHQGYSGGRNDVVFYGSPSFDFECGSGLGMTPGRHAPAVAARAARHARQDAERAARVPALIAADPRNACTAFRITGEVCTSHAAPVADVDPDDAYVSPWSTVAA